MRASRTKWESTLSPAPPHPLLLRTRLFQRNICLGGCSQQREYPAVSAQGKDSQQFPLAACVVPLVSNIMHSTCLMEQVARALQKQQVTVKENMIRPSWTSIVRVTEGREITLFKEKFCDFNSSVLFGLDTLEVGSHIFHSTRLISLETILTTGACPHRNNKKLKPQLLMWQPCVALCRARVPSFWAQTLSRLEALSTCGGSMVLQYDSPT